MQHLPVDVAVIGAGTAGLAAYRAAVAAGKRAVIIEGGPFGTTCARVGCMPSKLLIAAAEAAHGVERWPAFGLRLDGALRVDGRAVMDRVRRERDRFVGFVLEGVEGIPVRDKLIGYARFTGPTTLEVLGATGQVSCTVEFGRAVIATGSSPDLPLPLRAAGDRLIFNDDVFDWHDLPSSVAVFGPGVIGLELGQALHRLGVAVHVFGRSGRVGPFQDPALQDYARRTMAAEFPLHADASDVALTRNGDTVEVRFSSEGQSQTVRVDYVLAATGRTPNVRGLGLERTGITLDGRGIPLFDRHTLQCGDSHIFIAGDANADLPLLHEAADEGRIAGDNAARWPHVVPGQRRTPIAVVFSDPQMAVVGSPFASLDPSRTVTGAVSFEDQGRSRVMLRNKGLLHVYADIDSGLLLGAEMIGPDAEHIAHLLAWVIQLGQTVDGVLALPFYHPVVEEGLRTALRNAKAQRDVALATRTMAA
jgi:dihydrolipoamide dehydrogenase